MTMAYIGQPINRVDGHAKVTGAAKYAAEYQVPDLAYGFVVSSTIARGRVTRIDPRDAIGVPGVLQVITHENAGRLPSSNRVYEEEVGPPGKTFIPLQDAKVRFSGQPVALVVATSFETARYAASLVRVDYKREEHLTDLEAARAHAYEPVSHGLPAVPKPRGNARRAFEKAATKVDVQYRVPVEHHNPMELFGTTAVWEENGTLRVYDKTQGVKNVHGYLCSLFDAADDDIVVLSPFVGGAFGVGLRPQYQVFLAVLAAHALKRSVRVTLTRQQMFGLAYRPVAWQRVALAAAPDGRLEALVHEAVSNTSRFEDYSETIVHWSGMLYHCDNVTLTSNVARLDLNTPADMRAPGASWGLYALECAMDELADQMRLDPLDLRLMNYAESDQNNGVPFSSKALRECYRQGAEMFGWSKRTPQPRSMREGDALIGWGMATGVWEAPQLEASAAAVLTADGELTVSSATADIGTGTRTIMTQIAAEVAGVPIDKVTFKLGDSSLPSAPVEGGSFTAATVGSAVKAVCEKVRERLLAIAGSMDSSPFAGVAPADVTFADGRMNLRRDASKSISYAEVMQHGELESMEESVTTTPADPERYGRYTHSAVFAEVRVDEELGTIQVTRVVSAVAGGRILNPKTARSQVLGGIVWGIGMALEEHSVIDQAFGRFITHNLADYHVPVNADIHDIDVIFVEERDEVVNPLGAKGLGEIGVLGVAPAIANAVFHATGRRIRELPMTLDKLL